jgi:hypothetical protein
MAKSRRSAARRRGAAGSQGRRGWRVQSILYGPEKRAVLELWTNHVLTIIGEPAAAGLVIMFPARAGN